MDTWGQGRDPQDDDGLLLVCVGQFGELQFIDGTSLINRLLPFLPEYHKTGTFIVQ